MMAAEAQPLSVRLALLMVEAQSLSVQLALLMVEAQPLSVQLALDRALVLQKASLASDTQIGFQSLATAGSVL